MVTVNAAEDGNVDNVPGAVSTGYQAQNTLAVANQSGRDSISITPTAGGFTANVGGSIEVSGILFTLKEDVNLVLLSSGSNYIKVTVSGTTANLVVTNVKPAFDATKNGWYDSGERVLNTYVYAMPGPVLTEIIPNTVALDNKVNTSLYFRYVYSSDTPGAPPVFVDSNTHEFTLKKTDDQEFRMLIPTLNIPFAGAPGDPMIGKAAVLAMVDNNGDLITTGASMERYPFIPINEDRELFRRLFFMFRKTDPLATVQFVFINLITLDWLDGINDQRCLYDYYRYSEINNGVVTNETFASF